MPEDRGSIGQSLLLFCWQARLAAEKKLVGGRPSRFGDKPLRGASDRRTATLAHLAPKQCPSTDPVA